MASFGDGVSALIETYTKCLRLLKAFKGRDSDIGSFNLAQSEVHSLRKSLRSNRTQIRRTYATKLSNTGKRLEKGDSRSKSALRRILERLRNAIISLLNTAKILQPVVDYESLMSLSNSSRVDAIRTMDQLSSRLSSSSSLLRENRRPRPLSSSSKPTSTSSSDKKRHSRRGYSSSMESNMLRTTTPPLKNASSTTENLRKKKSVISGSNVVKHRNSNGNPSWVGVSFEEESHTRDTNRISYVSISSDSTKLGEIPSRRSRLVKQSDGKSPKQYEMRPVYPLHSYQTSTREKRGLLRRIFGSGER